MEIVILDGYTANPGDLSWEGFSALGSLRLYPHPPTGGPAETLQRIGTAQAVISNKTPLPREVLQACPQIQYIGLLSTGYNIVDIGAARAAGIPVCNIPGYSTHAVAQFTFALLLEICNRVGHHDASVHEGRWTHSRDFCYWDYPLIELLDKTMGIIGLGRIGRQVAKIAAAMGMKVVCHGGSGAKNSDLAEYTELGELYQRADVVSLHCPLFPETRGMINAESIAAMKDGVILLNTARGPLVDEQALADALNSGKVYAAGVDVAAREPIPANSPLLKAKNCFITPHIAWAPREARARLIEIAVGNLRAFLAGAPQNVVNSV